MPRYYTGHYTDADAGDAAARRAADERAAARQQQQGSGQPVEPKDENVQAGGDRSMLKKLEKGAKEFIHPKKK